MSRCIFTSTKSLSTRKNVTKSKFPVREGLHCVMAIIACSMHGNYLQSTEFVELICPPQLTRANWSRKTKAQITHNLILPVAFAAPCKQAPNPQTDTCIQTHHTHTPDKHHAHLKPNEHLDFPKDGAPRSFKICTLQNICQTQLI